MSDIAKALPWIAFWAFMAVSTWKNGPTIQITTQADESKTEDISCMKKTLSCVSDTTLPMTTSCKCDLVNP